MSDATQTIFRVACRHKPYSQLGNAMLRDKRLSIGARGALAMILSHPTNWRFSPAWLYEAACVGRDQGKKLIKELIEFGYCVRTRERLGNGTLGPYEYVFSDEPDTGSSDHAPETSDWKPVTGNPATGNPPPTKKDNNKQKDKAPTVPSGTDTGGRAKRLAADFEMPDEWRTWAAKDAPKHAGLIAREADKFADHFRGSGTRKIDWLATWRNWWRRAVEEANRRPVGATSYGRPIHQPKHTGVADTQKPDLDEPKLYRVGSPEFEAYADRLPPDEAAALRQRGSTKLRRRDLSGPKPLGSVLSRILPMGASQ